MKEASVTCSTFVLRFNRLFLMKEHMFQAKLIKVNVPRSKSSSFLRRFEEIHLDAHGDQALIERKGYTVILTIMRRCGLEWPSKYFWSWSQHKKTSSEMRKTAVRSVSHHSFSAVNSCSSRVSIRRKALSHLFFEKEISAHVIKTRPIFVILLEIKLYPT